MIRWFDRCTVWFCHRCGTVNRVWNRCAHSSRRHRVKMIDWRNDGS